MDIARIPGNMIHSYIYYFQIEKKERERESLERTQYSLLLSRLLSEAAEEVINYVTDRTNVLYCIVQLL